MNAPLPQRHLRSATPAAPVRRLSRRVDAAIAFPLLIVHAALGLGGSVLVGLAITAMRNCVGELCPSTDWVILAQVAAAAGLAGFLILDLIGIIVALSMRKPAWMVPLATCGMNLAWIVVVLMLLAQAGRP